MHISGQNVLQVLLYECIPDCLDKVAFVSTEYKSVHLLGENEFTFSISPLLFLFRPMEIDPCF